MLCELPIADYVIAPVHRVKRWLAQGYRLYGNVFYRPREHKRAYQVLVKTHPTYLPSRPFIMPWRLSPFEKQCIQGLLAEKSNKEMAQCFHRSQRAVEHALARLRCKFGCKKNIGIVLQAQRYGFIVNGQWVS